MENSKPEAEVIVDEKTIVVSEKINSKVDEPKNENNQASPKKDSTNDMPNSQKKNGGEETAEETQRSKQSEQSSLSSQKESGEGEYSIDAEAVKQKLQSVIEENKGEDKAGENKVAIVDASVVDKKEDANAHALQFAWTFWYVYTLSHREKKKMKRVRHYEYVLHEVFTFSTLEDFWRMFNNTYQTSEVISNTDYLMFKKHIKPEWEDPANRAGGKWVITAPIEEDMEEEVAEAWTSLLLSVIGGQFNFHQMEVINGVIYSIRDKHQRMSIWCMTDPRSSPESRELILSIGQVFQKMVKLPEKYKFQYQLHEKALKHDLDNEAMLTV